MEYLNLDAVSADDGTTAHAETADG
jgi:hypothetical protein